MVVTRDKVDFIVNASFPTYRGHKFSVKICEKITFHDVFWGGGTRNTYAAVSLDGDTVQQADVGSYFGANIEGLTINIPQNVAIVQHSIFCGKDSGLRIHIRPENAASFLPPRTDLTDRDKKILAIYRGIKSGPYRREYLERAKVTADETDSLVSRGYLKRNAAGNVQITMEGKNACEGVNAY